MSVLSPPRLPIIQTALDLARTWCAGHTIDNAPALKHAVAVALTIEEHHPDPAPALIAAALLHDSPEYAPADCDLDGLLTSRFGAETTRIVRELERFHAALDAGTPHTLDLADTATVLAATADKIVAFSSILARGDASPDPLAFWHVRRPFRERLPWFRQFHTDIASHVPAAMSAALGQLITTAETATGLARTGQVKD